MFRRGRDDIAPRNDGHDASALKYPGKLRVRIEPHLPRRQDERIRAQRFGFDGTKNGSEFRANTIAGLHRVPMVACLTNGNIVIGWRARLPGPLLVHLQIFDSNGPVGEQTTSLDITEAAMTALDSGRFVIAHIRSALDGEPAFS